MNHKTYMDRNILIIVVTLALFVLPRQAMAGTCTSTGTGSWNASGTWSCGYVPTASDDVVIADGHTVTIDTDVSAASITVGQGSSGILTFDSTVRAVSVTGNVTVSSGATFITQASGAATHSLSIGGNLTNDGTLDMSRGGTTLVCNVTFNKNGNQTISGSGATSRFNNITLNMGSSNTNVLDVQAVITMASGGLTLTNGTFKLSSASTITPFASSTTIGATKGFWVNGGTVNTGDQSWTLSSGGLLRVSAGTLNLGTSIGNSLKYSTVAPSIITIEGGALNIAGRLSRDADTARVTYTQSGGTVTVVKSGSTSTSYAGFDIGASGSSFTMSGGTIVVQRATSNSDANGGDYLVAASTSSVTGGTLQIGNSSTPASQTIRIQSSAPIYNLTVYTTNAPTAKLLLNALAVKGDAEIQSPATLDANGIDISLDKGWTNNGAFTAGTGKVTFNGSGTSTISGSSTTTFYDLEISSNTTLDVSTNTLFNATNSVRNYGKLKQTKTVGTDNAAFLNLSSGKYSGVEVDPSDATSMGSTTVTIYGEQTCPTPPSLGVTTIKRCFDIAPATSTAATVKFWYDATNELNSNTPGSVKAYYQEGGLWHEATGTYTRASGTFNSVEVTGVSTFSRYALTSNTPSESNLITLTRFEAAPAVGGGIAVAWETASEIGTAGYHLWRSDRQDTGYGRITAALLPARGGPTHGAAYTFTDRHTLPGRVYYYRLEEVALSGLSAFYGPTGPVIGLAHGPVFRAFLPIVGEGCQLSQSWQR